jgi:prolyl-tRNA synthetase
LVWPASIAPYQVYLASLGDEVKSQAEELYDQLKQAGLSVLYDDRDERPGEKFADADLFGIPFRVVVSQKSLEAGGFELKERLKEDIQVLPRDSLIQTLTIAGQAWYNISLP